MYRVNSDGNTLDFLLAAKRDTEVAKRFLCKMLNAVHTQEPRLINVDQNAAYLKAIEELKEKEKLSLQVKLRHKKHLNEGYDGKDFITAAKEVYRLDWEVVKRKQEKGFKVLPWLWIVERTLA